MVMNNNRLIQEIKLMMILVFPCKNKKNMGMEINNCFWQIIVYNLMNKMCKFEKKLLYKVN